MSQDQKSTPAQTVHLMLQSTGYFLERIATESQTLLDDLRSFNVDLYRPDGTASAQGAFLAQELGAMIKQVEALQGQIAAMRHGEAEEADTRRLLQEFINVFLALRRRLLKLLKQEHEQSLTAAQPGSATNQSQKEDRDDLSISTSGKGR